MDSTVKQMLAGKDSNEVWSISPEETILYALEYMSEKNIGALPVLEDDILIGIFSERDYARILPPEKLSPDTTKISEVMTKEVFCISPKNTACDCMGMMTEKRIETSIQETVPPKDTVSYKPINRWYIPAVFR